MMQWAFSADRRSLSLAGASLAGAGAVGALLAAYAAGRRSASAGAGGAGAGGAADLSTTSSSHTGAVYETERAVQEYCLFHFGADAAILPYAASPAVPTGACAGAGGGGGGGGRAPSVTRTPAQQAHS